MVSGYVCDSVDLLAGGCGSEITKQKGSNEELEVSVCVVIVVFRFLLNQSSIHYINTHSLGFPLSSAMNSVFLVIAR